MRDPSDLASRENESVGIVTVVGALTALCSALALLRIARIARARYGGEDASARRVMDRASVACCVVSAATSWLNLGLDASSVARDAFGSGSAGATFLVPLAFYAWLLARERCDPVFFRQGALWLRPFLYVLLASQAFVLVSVEIGSYVTVAGDKERVAGGLSTALLIDAALVAAAALLFLVPFKAGAADGHLFVARVPWKTGPSTAVAAATRRALAGTLLYVLVWVAVWVRFYLYRKASSANASVLAAVYYLSTAFCVCLSHGDAACARPPAPPPPAGSIGLAEVADAGERAESESDGSEDDDFYDAATGAADDDYDAHDRWGEDEEAHGIGDVIAHRRASRDVDERV